MGNPWQCVVPMVLCLLFLDVRNRMPLAHQTPDKWCRTTNLSGFKPPEQHAVIMHKCLVLDFIVSLLITCSRNVMQTCTFFRTWTYYWKCKKCWTCTYFRRQRAIVKVKRPHEQHNMPWLAILILITKHCISLMFVDKPLITLVSYMQVIVAWNGACYKFYSTFCRLSRISTSSTLQISALTLSIPLDKAAYMNGSRKLGVGPLWTSIYASISPAVL